MYLGLTSGHWQFLRFLVVGAWNTCFAFGLFAGFNYYLSGRLSQPYDYVSASLLSGVVNTNLAFIWQKYLVFRTHGNLWREYVRCCMVYGASALAYTAVLPAFVWMARLAIGDPKNAPYAGAGCLTVLNVLVLFAAHKYYSFGNWTFRGRRAKTAAERECPRP